MMTDLFNETEETLSPREKWMKLHGVSASQVGELWGATDGRETATADTKDEAIADLARKLSDNYGIPPWRM